MQRHFFLLLHQWQYFFKTDKYRLLDLYHYNHRVKSGYNTYRGWTQIGYQDRHRDTNRKEEGTWDGQRRDGGTNATVRIKEKEKRLTLNEHDDDDDDNHRVKRWYTVPNNTTHILPFTFLSPFSSNHPHTQPRHTWYLRTDPCFSLLSRPVVHIDHSHRILHYGPDVILGARS
jgi:hypothetical protein